MLYTPGGGGGSNTTYYKDWEGTTVNTWPHSNGPASMPYLMPDSTIIYPFRVPNPTMEAGGVGGGIQSQSWDGIILWEYIFSDENYQHHHDIEPLPNGNILMIAWERFEQNDTTAQRLGSCRYSRLASRCSMPPRS